MQEVCGIQAEVRIVGQFDRGRQQLPDRCQRYPIQWVVRRRMRDAGSLQNGIGRDAARFERTYNCADVSADDGDVCVI